LLLIILWVLFVGVDGLKGEVQTALSDLREQTMEAATAVSAFTKVVRSHTALTLESGQMLEEVWTNSHFYSDWCSFVSLQ
jgi:hypothetical protein